jgi:cytochrome d ubiquinol oxidase subunit II
LSLAEVPIIVLLVGLVAYIVLAGADFGAGLWELGAGRGERGAALREHCHRAMGPVWEANHVWLVFVLVVCWTAYPEAFGSIFSTLGAALLLAAIGIILRGAGYVVRSVSDSRWGSSLFAVSSILTPFALGAAIGGIASERVPVGNAEGDLITSWINPTSILIGALAVSFSAYLAATFLAGDAARVGSAELTEAFRRRALGAGVVAGALAAGGLVVLESDADHLYDGLTEGAGLVAVAASGAAGIATLVLVFRRRFEPARYTAAVAVAAIIAGWGIAQSPQILPGLTIEEAAADDSTLIALLAGVVVGAFVLLPSLALLFGLTLQGRFDPGAGAAAAEPAAQAPLRAGRLHLPVVAALLGAGTILTVAFDGGIGLALGVITLLAFVAVGFVGLSQAFLAAPEED